MNCNNRSHILKGSPSMKTPYNLDRWFNEIEWIRTYDPLPV